MSISIDALFQDVCQEIGRGVGDERVSATFPRAVNRTLDELAVSADSASKFPHISSTTGTISGISENYEYIVYAGTVFNMIRLGYKPADPNIARVMLEDTYRRWIEAKADYSMDIDNIAQAVADADIIGNGDVG